MNSELHTTSIDMTFLLELSLESHLFARATTFYWAYDISVCKLKDIATSF